jgi:hypothetical protein
MVHVGLFCVVGAVVAWYGSTIVTWELFWDLVNKIGPWAALAILALWASMTGRFRWSREFAQAEKDTAQLRKDYEQQLAMVTRDRDWWRDRATVRHGRIKSGNATMAGMR